MYYLTPADWEEADGGYLQLFNSNGESIVGLRYADYGNFVDHSEPTTVATSLPPLRNSLLLFEVLLKN